MEHRLANKAEHEGEAYCTNCNERHTPAVTRCLQCEVSLCETHQSLHKTEEHVLPDPTSCLVSWKFPIHQEPLDYYCTEDEALGCVSCGVFGDHKGHQMELLEHITENLKKELPSIRQAIISQRERIEKTNHELDKEVNAEYEKATVMKSRVAHLFGDIRTQVEKMETRVLDEINSQHRRILSNTRESFQQMERKMEVLHQRVLGIDKLLGVLDPRSFIGEYKQTLQKLSQHGRSVTALDKLDDELIEVTLQDGLLELVEVLPKLKQHWGFNMKAPSDTLLDADTASVRIALSKDLKTAFHVSKEHLQPCGQKQFMFCQVLSINGFTSGQHYVAVQIRGNGYWTVGLAYPSIQRTGTESLIGCNDKSWGLSLVDGALSSLHDSKAKAVAADIPLTAIGIYLDYNKGRLSFYQMSKQIKRLYTFSTIFTEPLHLAFYICGNTRLTILG